MKNIKITVSVEDTAYGEALARGLAQRNSRIMVAVRQDPGMEDGDLLLTDMDREDLRQGWPPEKVMMIDGEFRGLARMEREILIKLYENDGEELAETGEKCPAFFCFRGAFGGSGTTAASILAGRFMSANYGHSVLFLNLGKTDDYTVYAEADFSSVRGKKELIYRIEEDMPWHFAAYGARDRWGVTYFRADDGVNVFSILGEDQQRKLLKQLDAAFGPDVVIVDMGLEKFPVFVQRSRCNFCVANWRDMRVRAAAASWGADMAGENEVFILNHGGENGWNGNVLKIACDDESFTLKDENTGGRDGTRAGREEQTEKGRCVAISPNKSFAIGIKNLAEYMEQRILNTDVES